MNDIPTQSNNYQTVLQTPMWAEKRKEILQRDGKKCRNCGTAENLQVHHRQYHIIKKTGNFMHPWNYDGRYLITLCNKCHKFGHEKYSVNIFEI